jgi:hypothetical protein
MQPLPNVFQASEYRHFKQIGETRVRHENIDFSVNATGASDGLRGICAAVPAPSRPESRVH